MSLSAVFFWFGLMPVGAVPPAKEDASAGCLSCHDDQKLKGELRGKEVSLHVSSKVFRESVHQLLDCSDCHKGMKDYPHDANPAPVSCGECHAQAQKAFETGLHARAGAQGNGGAVHCADCHGKAHEILPSDDPRSSTYRTHIPRTCGSCHGVQFVVEPSGLSTQPFFAYQKSIHGKAVAAESMKAAVCTDCHRSHDIRSAADSQSPIFKFSVPKTCGACHPTEEKEFMASIHGQGVRRGNSHSPVCTDCHGIHLIKDHIDPTSPVAFQTMARTACGQCHEGVKLTQEFGVVSGRINTYMDSYHGLASRLGSRVVANCASCHGIHSIFPSSDPRSTVHRSNLVKTCGHCHPGAGENFSKGKIHLGTPEAGDLGGRINEWVRGIYLALIVLVIGGMLTHNILDWRRKVLARHGRDDRWLVRMNRSHRLQHLLLVLSFTYLALTGFALKFPDSWLAWLVGSDETMRRMGHRVAGLFLLGLGGFHLVVSLSTREGRRLLMDLLPGWKDVQDVITNLRHFTRKRAPRARFGRFGYPEKLEYWAVVWGTVIMGVTGLAIWLKVDVTHYLPRWFIDVATTIHFYEAILAILAIFVWHFYHVIFDPEVYPYNTAWWDGKVSERWYRKEHPLDDSSTPHSPTESDKEKPL